MVAEIEGPLRDWRLLAEAWDRSLRADNKAESTRKTYRQSLSRFAKWASAPAVNLGPYDVTEDDVTTFFAELFDTPTRYGRPPEPESVAKDVRQLKVFFVWLARKESVPNPMADYRAPIVPDKPIPVFEDDELRQLLKACPGETFTPRRDRAILRLFFDAGIRHEELTDLDLPDVNFDEQYVDVLGKGRRRRKVPYGAATAEALDDYLRVRMRHPDSKLAAFWLAAPPRRGAFGYDGVHQMLKRVGRRAGVANVNAHRFRHTAAHTVLDTGEVSEGDAMLLFGWRTRSMVDRYGASAAHARAMRAARRASHADRI